MAVVGRGRSRPTWARRSPASGNVVTQPPISTGELVQICTYHLSRRLPPRRRMSGSRRDGTSGGGRARPYPVAGLSGTLLYVAWWSEGPRRGSPRPLRRATGSNRRPGRCGRGRWRPPTPPGPIALTWASNELWAASAMAPWKSGPAARRDRLDRRGSSRRSSIRSMSVNCHTTTSASSRGQARRGRVPVFGRTSTSLWPAAPCRLPDDRAADAELRRQLVLVREWRSAAPRLRRMRSPCSSTTRP